MMYEREINPKQYKDPLWEEISKDLYQHVIYGHKTSSPPLILDSRGFFHLKIKIFQSQEVYYVRKWVLEKL